MSRRMSMRVANAPFQAPPNTSPNPTTTPTPPTHMAPQTPTLAPSQQQQKQQQQQQSGQQSQQHNYHNSPSPVHSQLPQNGGSNPPSSSQAPTVYSQTTFANNQNIQPQGGSQGQTTTLTPSYSNAQTNQSPGQQSTFLPPSPLNTQPSGSGGSNLSMMPSTPSTTPGGRASISGYRTMRSLRSTMDPSVYQSPTASEQSSGSFGNELPAHLQRNNINQPELSVTRTKGEEFSVIKTKEEEEEDYKLREKEKTMTWDDIKKMEDHCLQVRAEILSTEATYVKKLSDLIQYYVTPLMQMNENQLQDQIGITSMHRTALVLNLTVIHGFQEKFNSDLIRAGPMKAEETLIQYSHFFRLYSQYATEYQKMVDTMGALINSKKFQAFTTIVDHQLAGGIGSGGSELLPSYLILPIQRIPRYELLLRELKRHTLPSRPEFEIINKALNLVKQSATHINETGKNVENKQKLISLQKRIKGDMKDFVLVQPFRKHMRESTVALSEPHKKSLFGTIKSGVRNVFLFNDIILWTNPDFEYKAHINIASISQCQQVAPYVLEIATSEKLINLNFFIDKGMPPMENTPRGEEIKNLHDQWFNDISTLVAETQAERRRKRQIQSRNDTTRTATHRLIVNKFNTLDRKQMEELQAEQARQRETSIAEGQ